MTMFYLNQNITYTEVERAKKSRKAANPYKSVKKKLFGKSALRSKVQSVAQHQQAD